MAIFKKLISALKVFLGATPKRVSKVKKRKKKRSPPSRAVPTKRKTVQKKPPLPRKSSPQVAKASKKNKSKSSVPKTSPNKKEVIVGEITHFFPKIQVGVLKVTGQSLNIGETIIVKSKDGQFIQKVKSLQIESVDVSEAKKNQLVGLKLEKPAQPGEKIFKWSK